MKVSVVCPNMASNALGRAMVLAQLAHRAGHTAQIVGPMRRDQQIWSPALTIDPHIQLVTTPISTVLDYPAAIRAIGLACAGGVTIVSKPVPTSMGFVLAAGIAPAHTILDIDDWELGFVVLDRDKPAPLVWLDILHDLLKPRRFNSYLGRLGAEALTRRYPLKIASNSWLQERFGGVIIPHVRDADELDPVRVSGDAVRLELKLSDERRWVGFVGTPRAHKGVDVLIDALALLTGEGAPGLVLLGADRAENPVVGDILERAEAALGADRLRVKGMFPFDQLAQHVAALDILTIPSLHHEASVGQIPAKVFDALAMRRPTIVSDVNDLAQIVGDAALVVPPGDVAALSAAIARLDKDAALREGLGRAARARFMAHYTLDAAAPALERLIEAASRS